MSAGRAKSRSRHDGLSPLGDSEIAALNRAFYASDPGDYLSVRLQHLVRLASRSDEILRREEQKHVFGNLTMTIPSVSEDPADEDAHKRLVLIEAEMLLHHTAETLLRLFFAHATKPDVPWIEADRLRGPGQFKKELKARFKVTKASRLRRDIGCVFMGRREARGDMTPEDRADRENAVDRIAEYLGYFANVLLEREAIYNGAKHGLAVQAGEPAIRIGDIEQLSANGPAISYLKKQKKKSGAGREWMVATQWINLEKEFSFVYLGTWLIKALWLAARIRYVNWPPPKDGISFPSLSVQEVLDAANGATQSESVISAISVPPEMHSPPGSGSDSLIADLDPDGQ